MCLINSWRSYSKWNRTYTMERPASRSKEEEKRVSEADTTDRASASEGEAEEDEEGREREENKFSLSLSLAAFWTSPQPLPELRGSSGFVFIRAQQVAPAPLPLHPLAYTHGLAGVCCSRRSLSPFCSSLIFA